MQYKIGQCVFIPQANSRGIVVGHHGSAEYYAVKLEDGVIFYAWDRDMIPATL